MRLDVTLMKLNSVTHAKIDLSEPFYPGMACV